MNEYNSPSIRNFLTMYYKRRKMIFFISAAIVFLVMAGTIIIDPTYKAVAKILIQSNRADVYTPTTVKSERGIGKIFRFDEERITNAEVEILKSPVLLERVVSLLGPDVIYPGIGEPGIKEMFLPFLESGESAAEKTLFRLQENLTIKGIKKSNVIEVSFTHGDPKIAARVVEELVTVYISQHMQVHTRNKSFDFYQKQSKVLEAKLIKSENRLLALKKEHNVSSPEAELELLVNRESDIKAEWNQTQIKINETEQRIILLQKQLAGTTEKIKLHEEIGNNKYAESDLEDKLVQRELQKTLLEHKYTDEFPYKAKMIAVKIDEIRIIKNRIKEITNKPHISARYGTNVVYQNLKMMLLKNEAELYAFKAKSETLLSQLKDHRKKIIDMNQLQLKFNRLINLLEANKRNHQEYVSKFEESRISNAMDKDKFLNVHVFDSPKVPQKPANRNFSLNLVLSMIFGFMAAIGIALILECMDDRLQTVEDVGQWLNLPVLATVPLKSSLNQN